MVLVYASDVGTGAWSRMVRDGAIVPLTRSSGHAADVDRTPALRAASLASVVPQRAVLTGLAALWVHGWEAGSAAPLLLEVAVPRGCHPGVPPSTDPHRWSFVTDQATCRTATVVGGVRVADASHAVAAALARGPLASAIAAAFCALATQLLDAGAVDSAMTDSAHGDAGKRARSAWNAVCAATGGR